MPKITNFSTKKGFLSKKEITQINKALWTQLATEAQTTVKNAEILNRIFSDLKKYQQQRMSTGVADMSSIAIGITQHIITENLANTLYQSANLAASPNQTAGVVFEKIFSDAVNTISKTYDLGVKAVESGQDSAIVGMETIADNIVQQVQETGIQTIEQQTAANNTTDYSGTKLTVGVARQGKNDVTIQVNGELKAGLSDELQQLHKILSNATFSIKSYQNMEGIEVGSTGMEKAIMGALLGLGYTFAEAKSIYNRGQGQMEQDAAVSKLFYNLQLAYETRGMGLLDVKNGTRVPTAKYLVQNDYSNNGDIRIYSTAQMVLTKLNTFTDLWTSNKGIKRAKTYTYSTGNVWQGNYNKSTLGSRYKNKK